MGPSGKGPTWLPSWDQMPSQHMCTAAELVSEDSTSARSPVFPPCVRAHLPRERNSTARTSATRHNQIAGSVWDARLARGRGTRKAGRRGADRPACHDQLVGTTRMAKHMTTALAPYFLGYCHANPIPAGRLHVRLPESVGGVLAS